jgi:hypothetical protein
MDLFCTFAVRKPKPGMREKTHSVCQRQYRLTGDMCLFSIILNLKVDDMYRLVELSSSRQQICSSASSTHIRSGIATSLSQYRPIRLTITHRIVTPFFTRNDHIGPHHLLLLPFLWS